ncbi:hypothetical protein ACNUDN_30255 [Mycobacterium sp. smrl_JER01]
MTTAKVRPPVCTGTGPIASLTAAEAACPIGSAVRYPCVTTLIDSHTMSR